MPPEWKPREEDNFSPKSAWQAQESSMSERYYALWQLLCCVPGFVAILFYKDILSPTALWFCMSLCITSITQTALIFKDNKYRHFRMWESLRLLMFLVFLPWSGMEEMSVIYSLILYLLLSLFYQFFVENTLENILLKKYLKHEKT